jgi:RNA polymerase sigma factor (sigma-70 family)
MSRPFPHRKPPLPIEPQSPGPMAPSVKDWLATCSRLQPLSERTVLELARRIHHWQQHPDGPSGAPHCLRRRAIQARDHLVRHNLRLIGHTWGKHRSALPSCDEGTADAFQEAALALVRAAELFDPSRGYCFSTYASFWVRRGFGQYERRSRRMIRLPHDKAELVKRALRIAAQEFGRTGVLPSLDWIAERCGPRGSAVDPVDLEDLLVVWRQSQPMELDRPTRSEEEGKRTLAVQLPDPAVVDVSVHDGLVEEADFPDGPATYATCAADSGDPQRSLLPVLLERLDSVSRRLLWHRYLREHPLSPKQIKKVMGLSLEEQQRLEAEALAVLRSAAQEFGAL